MMGPLLHTLYGFNLGLVLNPKILQIPRVSSLPLTQGQLPGMYALLTTSFYRGAYQASGFRGWERTHSHLPSEHCKSLLHHESISQYHPWKRRELT